MKPQSDFGKNFRIFGSLNTFLYKGDMKMNIENEMGAALLGRVENSIIYK
ncbi:Uncharacterized protein dnm_032210 [Desulfonema magnum]|uniref:Uncharacterized protein n=1 Tax=Desulfonema magnum TaxID=45655 RepID=A0A975GMQ6_9BACT|nr:Uncharacterized protein dnm_032210 [Desulfonema magnum]